jgi:hypothetical protein
MGHRVPEGRRGTAVALIEPNFGTIGQSAALELLLVGRVAEEVPWWQKEVDSKGAKADCEQPTE